MARTRIQEFLDTLGTFEHKRGMELFEKAVKDLGTAQTATLGVLLTASNQVDPNAGVPHGLLTAEAGREVLELVGWPASLPVVRFLALYCFTLERRDWTPKALEKVAGTVKIGGGADAHREFRKAIAGGRRDEAAALAAYLTEREGVDTATRALVSATLGDVGRLQHNLGLAVGFADSAKALGDPAGIVAVANGAYEVAAWMKEYSPPALEPLDAPPVPARPDLVTLEEALFDDRFDEVHAQIKGYVTAKNVEEVLRPLLIAASLEPGFLGHTMIAAHAARRALPYLTAEERSFLLWKFYRILVRRFGYPEGLLLRSSSGVAPEAAVEALKASLKIKTPPVERTLRDALESGVPLEKALQHVAYNWTNWTVGEKEHTLQYLNAALQTAAFLGREQAMLPLVSTMYKLPF